MASGKAKRLSIGTESLQIAKEKLRQFESAQARGGTPGLPTKSAIPDLLAAYVVHIRSAKTPKSAQTDIYYLRDAFGPVCDGLKVISRRLSAQTNKRPAKPGQDRRRKAPVIESPYFEAITTAQISAFIAGRMASRGLAPKTGNRIRDTLSALFSWAMTQRGILWHDVPKSRRMIRIAFLFVDTRPSAGRRPLLVFQSRREISV
jgi:hypothetical protein